MSSRACLAEGWDVVDEDEVVLSPLARSRLTGREGGDLMLITLAGCRLTGRGGDDIVYRLIPLVPVTAR